MISTLENAFVLAQFERLAQDNRNPILGVYRGRSLTITSYDTDSCLEKLTLALKSAWFAILTFFGALEVNAVRIRQLKTEVYRYHYQQVAEHFANEIKIIADNFKEQKERYQAAISKIKTAKTNLKDLIEQLKLTKAELIHENDAMEFTPDDLNLTEQNKLKTILDALKSAEGVLKEEKAAKKERKTLKTRRKDLENKIETLKINFQSVSNQASEQMPLLKTELARVQSELSQKAQRRVYRLEEENKNLTQKLQQAERCK